MSERCQECGSHNHTQYSCEIKLLKSISDSLRFIITILLRETDERGEDAEAIKMWKDVMWRNEHLTMNDPKPGRYVSQGLADDRKGK